MAEVNTRPHRSTLRAAGGPAGGGARAAAPAAAVAAHRVLRGDPEGQLAVADQRGRRAVLGPARADRRARVGSHRRRAADRRARRRAPGAPGGRAPSADDTGPPGDLRSSTIRPGRPGALERKPRARSAEEQAFLALGDGAEAWLIKAAAAGAQRVRRKMAEAVDLAKLHGTERGRPRAAHVRGRRPVRRR